ncbi:chemokine binding protein [Raccoonpox virus]|uniref:Chemokine binding protein n=1 Tax=Raccoon poxvirus TaxID=10256 RepID=A0A0G3FXF9_RACVI|nr:Chemokine binding protein [Raccoonpox virus]YP_009143520.1 Chemokine binding protein [Raccoonpox virus]AKJ93635.1 Chemokine binding protein [Raccoonpox virus]AKJ93841.1 Chemokine binding protein [Raccoonpox virus]AOP31479.1 chemokine binding protein [Raccoonpox virus]
MKRYIILACVCLTAIASPLTQQQQACTEEGKHHMGIDVLIKATKKDQTNDKICQSVTTITETNEDNEDTVSDDSSESTVTHGDSTYYAVVGGGLETIVGFTGCPHIKSISEYTDGNTIYTRLSSVAPSHEESTAVSHEDALSMIKECEVSLQLKCSDEDKEGKPVDVPVRGSNLSHSKREHADIIGSTIVDTKCVQNFEMSVTIGDMCKESSDVMVNDVVKLIDESLSAGSSDNTSVDDTKLKSCV